MKELNKVICKANPSGLLLLQANISPALPGALTVLRYFSHRDRCSTSHHPLFITVYPRYAVPLRSAASESPFRTQPNTNPCLPPTFENALEIQPPTSYSSLYLSLKTQPYASLLSHHLHAAPALRGEMLEATYEYIVESTSLHQQAQKFPGIFVSL